MSSSTPLLSMLMMSAAAVLGAVGSYLYKTGAAAARGAVACSVVNARVLCGVACYVGVMVLFVAAFRRGGALTVLYPIYATTFIVAAVIAFMTDGTPIRPVNVGGMLLLILGIYLMGRQ